MPSWNNPGPKIFNDSIVQKSVAQRDYLGKYLSARAAGVSRKFTVRQYWTVNISGLQVNEMQLEEIRALERVTRYEEPFLLRLSSYCLIENANKEASLLGNGAGTYPVYKRSTIQGTAVTDLITYLNYDYPALRDLNGEDWTALDPFRVWGGSAPTWNRNTLTWSGNEITGACTIDRLNGLVTTDYGGNSWATGGFYWLMECRQGIGVTPQGACIFVIDDGVQLNEPFPEGGEVEG